MAPAPGGNKKAGAPAAPLPHAGGPEEAPPGRPVVPAAAALHVEGVEGTGRRLLAEATTCRLVRWCRCQRRRTSGVGEGSDYWGRVAASR